jgi:hypothetical protein
MWDTKFWLKSSEWPKDASTDVFLARAFDRVGKAMFGSEWEGTEVYTEVSPPIPTLIPPKSENYKYFESIVRAILKRHVGTLTPENWEEARRLHQQKHADANTRVQRRNTVYDAIVAGCQTGFLQTSYRPVAGGAFESIPTVWWNTERTAQRFSYCQINPNDPYAVGVAGDQFCWIFVTAESLAQFLVQSPHSEVASKFDGHLSPYMRVMVSVAAKMQITPENQPKKAAVEAELKTAWTLSKPLSANKIDVMATLLREPESELGRAGNVGGKEK